MIQYNAWRRCRHTTRSLLPGTARSAQWWGRPTSQKRTRSGCTPLGCRCCIMAGGNGEVAVMDGKALRQAVPQRNTAAAEHETSAARRTSPSIRSRQRRNAGTYCPQDQSQGDSLSQCRHSGSRRGWEGSHLSSLPCCAAGEPVNVCTQWRTIAFSRVVGTAATVWHRARRACAGGFVETVAIQAGCAPVRA